MILAQIRKQNVVMMVKVAGMRVLYHGFWATLYRDIVFNMVFFTTREYAIRAYERWQHQSPDALKRVLLGLPAGCFGCILSCPLDVVKTRLQGNESREKKNCL